MPDDGTQHKRTGFAEGRAEFAEVRTDMRLGFDRMEPRLGNLETRVDSNETEFRAFPGEIGERVSALENQSA